MHKAPGGVCSLTETSCPGTLALGVLSLIHVPAPPSLTLPRTCVLSTPHGKDAPPGAGDTNHVRTAPCPWKPFRSKWGYNSNPLGWEKAFP